jgi:Tfp pilus assembly protein PilO
MRRIMIVAVIAVLVVFAGWYEGLYRSEVSHINTLKATEQQTHVALLTLETHYVDLVRSKKELPQERAALARLDKAVPNGPELDGLVKTLFSAASATNVQLTSISSPQPPGFGVSSASAVTPAGPVELPLSLTVTGTSGAIENLYRVLDAEPRLFVINNFSVAPGTSSTAGASSTGTSTTGATITLDAFYASAKANTAAS